VAPCALGSIVASAIDSGGVTRAVRLDLPRRFGVAVVVPDFDLPTVKARAVLPTSYSREDAVFNVQRASLLIAALAAAPSTRSRPRWRTVFTSPTARPGAGLHEILKLRAPGLLGCALSGAAPRYWCSSSAATRACATWCARSSACTATNRRPCSRASRSTGLRWRKRRSDCLSGKVYPPSQYGCNEIITASFTRRAMSIASVSPPGRSSGESPGIALPLRKV